MSRKTIWWRRVLPRRWSRSTAANVSSCTSRRSMAKALNIRSVSAFLLASALGVAAAGIQAPAGTQIQIRLQSKVSSKTAKPKDAVEAAVIAPVVVSGQFVVPARATARGIVEKATASTRPDERSTLSMSFTEVEFGGAKYP